MSKRPYNPQTPHVLRTLAGLYLLYLTWSMRGELTRPGLFKLAPILFGLAGLFFVVTGCRTLFFAPPPAAEDEPHEDEEGEDEEDIDEEEDDQAEASEEEDDLTPDPEDARDDEEEDQ